MTNKNIAQLEKLPADERPVSVDTMVRRLLGPFAWVAAILRYIPYIGYGKVVRYENDLYEMDQATEALEWWSKDLNLGVEIEGIENVPSTGPVILCCNHPTGLGDGIAVWDAIKAHRPDFKIMMNAQGLDRIPVFRELLVPVRLASDGSTSDRRNMWRRLVKSVDEEFVIMTCPAGRLSQLDWFGDWDIHDLPWRGGIAKMAKSFPQATFVPVFIEGRLRKHYYLLHRLFPAIRDVLLYTELHSKRNWPFRIKFLPPVTFEDAREVQAVVEGEKTKKWFELPRRKAKK